MKIFKTLKTSSSDVRLICNSNKQSLTKLAPRLTIKACFPSIIDAKNYCISEIAKYTSRSREQKQY